MVDGGVRVACHVTIAIKPETGNNSSVNYLY